MPFRHRLLGVALGAAVPCLCTPATLPAQPPVDAPFHTGFALPVGIAWHGANTLYVAERGGAVQVVVNGTRLPTPLIDLGEEVGGWRDFGMLGFVLDPGFATNGHYYLSYVVDRHHLLHHGTPSYDAGTDEYFAATITRVTRYTADVATGFTTTVPGSRLVLFGEGPGTGSPILYESHGTGQLAFGSDGTLLVALGDGASYQATPDCGSAPETYWQQAITDGILRPEENVGAFRAQMLSSFSGKILRLDPATGDGLPSNPFYDAMAPRSPRSRVWTLGVRNPFRMCVRPGSGANDPSLGEPGTIYLGDVNWVTREELHVVHHGGHNLGWPLFEGIAPSAFAAHPVANPDAPNPLAGTGGCTQQFFTFQDLLQQASGSHHPFFPNPCDSMVGIAATTPTFVHEPPVLDWHHAQYDARVPVIENGALVTYALGAPGCPVAGPQFLGGCSVGGCWHSGLSFPPSFGACYYHADFGAGWIRRLEFDAGDQLLAVHSFAQTSYPMMLAEHPTDHGLVYVSLSDQLRTLGYGIEPPPVAVPVANVTHGTGDLTVQFDARASYDPEGQPLTYLWDLGYGQTSTSPQLGMTYPGTGTPALHQVQLTVTDSQGASDVATLPIAVDNTPPVVTITSFANGDTYPLTGPTTFPLFADVVDAEHGPTQLSYLWRTFLHHETHIHPDSTDTQPRTSTVITPTPTWSEFFAYRVELTVTDAGGLATTAHQWLLPDTTGASTSVLVTSPAIGDHIAPGAPVEFRAVTAGTCGQPGSCTCVHQVEYYVEGHLIGVSDTPPYAVSWQPTSTGPLTCFALAVGSDGTNSGSRGIPFVVDTAHVTLARGTAADADAVEALDQVSSPITNDAALRLGNDGTPWLTGLRFELPTIPVGAIVQAASIDFRAAQSDAATTRLTIRCDANPKALPIAATPRHLSRRANSAAVVTWHPEPWLTGDSGPAQRTPDLTSLLQPAVDHPNWQHAVVLLIRGKGLRQATTWNGDPLTGPLLSVTWLPPASNSSTATAGDDAGEALTTGTVDLGDTVLHLGEHQGTAQATALQFVLPLTAADEIDDARLCFTAAGVDSGPAVLTIRIEDSDDAAALAAATNDITARTLLATTVTWYPPEWPTAGANGSEQRSPNLAALVRAIVQRPGWQANGKILLRIDGSGARSAAALDAGLASAPRLEITWRQP